MAFKSAMYNAFNVKDQSCRRTCVIQLAAIGVLIINFLLSCVLVGFGVCYQPIPLQQSGELFSTVPNYNQTAIKKEIQSVISENEGTGLQFVFWQDPELQTKPVLHAGLRVIPSADAAMSALTIVSDTNEKLFIIQGVDLDNHIIKILSSGHYRINADVMYDNLSQLRVHKVLQLYKTKSAEYTTLVQISSGWSPPVSSSSISVSSSITLNKGDTLHLQVSRGGKVLENITKTHVTLFMI